MSNKKDPAFLFYSSDFIIGTMAMSWEDRGKYIYLMAYQHQNGHISEETIRLLLGSDWVNQNEVLRNKFEFDENGLLFNQRVDEEIEKRSNFTLSRRLNGSKGGRPKGKKETKKKASGKASVKASGKATNNHAVDVNENENISILFKDFKDNVDLQESLEQFRLMRAEIKKPLTERAAKMLLKELSKISSSEADMISILNLSVLNNWQSIYPLKENTKRMPANAVTHDMPTYSKSEEIDEDVDELRASLKKQLGG